MTCFDFCFPFGRPGSAKTCELTGKSAVVTGASEGLGVAMVHRLAAEGVTKIALAARRRDKLEQVAAELRQKHPGTTVLIVETDVAKFCDCERLAKEAFENFGSCDILVNNAGVPGVVPFDSAPAGRIDAIVDINLKGTLYLARCVLPSMVQTGRGHIVNIASLAGKGIEPYNSIYAASKYGVVGWSHALRAEMRTRKTGVTVHVICPGFVTDAGMATTLSQQLNVDAVQATVLEAAGSSSPGDVADAVICAIRNDVPEMIVNSKYRPWAFAKNIGLNHWYPRREDNMVCSPQFAPILAWLKAVAERQEMDNDIGRHKAVIEKLRTSA